MFIVGVCCLLCCVIVLYGMMGSFKILLFVYFLLLIF